MSANNKVSTKIETKKAEIEATIYTKINELRTEIKADSAPSTLNYQLSIQTNLLINMTKLLLISSNGHYSSHLKNIHMYHNLPNTYLPWPYKVTHFFKFKNCGIPYFLPYANPCQQTRAGRHKNISHQKTTIYISLSSHRTYILNFLQQNKTINHSP